MIIFLLNLILPVKWALHRMGLIKKGIRLPLTWLDEKYENILEKSLYNAGIIARN